MDRPKHTDEHTAPHTYTHTFGQFRVSSLSSKCRRKPGENCTSTGTGKRQAKGPQASYSISLQI